MKLLQRTLPLANTGKEFYLFSLFQGLIGDNIDSMFMYVSHETEQDAIFSQIVVKSFSVKIYKKVYQSSKLQIQSNFPFTAYLHHAWILEKTGIESVK